MKYSLIIHGGAGKGSPNIFNQIEKKFNIKNIENQHHQSLKECLQIGEDILKKGGKSVDAVSECIRYLEDNKLFNAGKGSVKDIDNLFSLGSCITEGKYKNFGAICSINNIKNPILLSKKLMEKKSIMISGNKSAKYFADKYDLQIVRSSYFNSSYRDKISEISKDLGTVGAVAIDNAGNICSGTSTGGKQYKITGRVGDTPLVGISTIADNNYVGISCTGEGEEIIKNNTASQILYRMKFNNQSMKKSIDDTLNDIKGSCGIIGIDKNYNIYYRKNTERMYVGYSSYSIKQTTELW